MSYFEIQRKRQERDRPLTKKQQKNLDELANKPDSEIDTSDIPELTPEQLSGMMPLKIARWKHKSILRNRRQKRTNYEWDETI
jgi:hypothetical protein